MKFKKIINLCKKNGQIRLFDGETEQWISDGYAMYPLFNMPKFDEESICRACDITEKQAEKMLIQHNEGLPSAFDYSDTSPNETQCEREEAIFGRTIPIITSHGMEFINGNHLLPFEDADDDMLYIFERTQENGQTYFVVKQGFALVGIIMPYDCINENFVRRLKNIYEQCEITLSNKKQ